MSVPPDDRRVRIYEVGPRDGLQNEAVTLATPVKARYIELLAAAGLRDIEATSFVSPRAIPQLADADDLLAGLERRPGVRYPTLVPNMRGLERAEAAGVDAIAVFTAATDAFTQHNIGMSVDGSLAAFAPVLARAGELGWWRRAYVSTAFGCPYTGRVDPRTAVEVGVRLRDLGADEICFGDTIGVGVPDQVAELVALAEAAGIGVERQAYHFHDTRGTALANVAMGLAAGVRTFDSAAGGTGGCPYAPGAAGNLATEDLVYFLDASVGARRLARRVLRPPGSSPMPSASRSPRRSGRREAGTRPRSGDRALSASRVRRPVSGIRRGAPPIRVCLLDGNASRGTVGSRDVRSVPGKHGSTGEGRTSTLGHALPCARQVRGPEGRGLGHALPCTRHVRRPERQRPPRDPATGR